MIGCQGPIHAMTQPLSPTHTHAQLLKGCRSRGNKS